MMDMKKQMVDQWGQYETESSSSELFESVWYIDYSDNVSTIYIS